MTQFAGLAKLYIEALNLNSKSLDSEAAKQLLNWKDPTKNKRGTGSGDFGGVLQSVLKHRYVLPWSLGIHSSLHTTHHIIGLVTAGQLPGLSNCARFMTTSINFEIIQHHMGEYLNFSLSDCQLRRTPGLFESY